jgi:hypothetical protein
MERWSSKRARPTTQTANAATRLLQTAATISFLPFFLHSIDAYVLFVNGKSTIRVLLFDTKAASTTTTTTTTTTRRSNSRLW